MEIIISENVYQIDINCLMVMGYRLNNSKRNFLFISKVLGKHLTVEPNICRAIGFLLASLQYGSNEYTFRILDYINNPTEYDQNINEWMKRHYDIDEKICIIGFAETATGLGMAVASAIKDSYYIHTTREDITSISNFIQFEEEHSHATNHLCFPIEEIRGELIGADRLILVDDELTTGKSVINMIKELLKVTAVKKFTVLSILDWRSNKDRLTVKEFCRVNNIDIEVKALISGIATSKDETIFRDNGTERLENKINKSSVFSLQRLPRVSCLTKNGYREYYKDSGRFGIEWKDIEGLEEVSKHLAADINRLLKKDTSKILVLGHGEDIYIPSRVAAHLKEQIRGSVAFRSTTRSPIFCMDEEDYPIKEKNCFEDEGITYYLYNRDEIEKNYDEVIYIIEKESDVQLISNQITVRL